MGEDAKKRDSEKRVTPKTCGTIRRDFLQLDSAKFLACRITACWQCEGSGCEDCNDAGYYLELDMAMPLATRLEIVHPFE